MFSLLSKNIWDVCVCVSWMGKRKDCEGYKCTSLKGHVLHLSPLQSSHRYYKIITVIYFDCHSTSPVKLFCTGMSAGESKN